MARLRAENEAEEKRLASAEMSANGGIVAATGGASAQHGGIGLSATDEIVEVNNTELEGLDEEEQMRMLLGFSGGFGSTSGKAVEDNQTSAAKGAANKTKARKYRQYMNRKGGFNRPLDKMP
jgi:U4/U6.U5 tri-snRNP-associated protein 3